MPLHTRYQQSFLIGPLLLVLTACQSTGVNPTGLTGGQVACLEGPRQTLDCRGALQQYARDFKLDLSTAMTQPQFTVGLGVASNKLTEADALSSDLIEHYYQTCTLYNACLITRQEYVARTEKLQQIQLDVRRALVAGGFGQQQNIQINPPIGGPVPGPGVGIPPPRGPIPGQPGLPQGAPPPAVSPGGVTAPVPPPQGVPDRLDAVLNILREGSKLFQEQKSSLAQTPMPSGAPPAATGASAAVASTQPVAQAQPAVQVQPVAQAPATTTREDLDASLRTMLVSLKQEIGSRDAALASAPAVVGNFNEEGQPWSGPLGAFLRDRVATLVHSEGLFNSGPINQSRGITVKQVAAVEDPNDPKALGALFNSDLAITGTYRPESDHVALQLTAFDAAGDEMAQVVKAISTQAIPAGVAALPANATNTSQLLDSLTRLGPRAQNGAKVEVTTNRPGAGASFRLGEQIRYFVTSTMDGYLYLFHVNADKSLLRIFPNRYQRETRIHAGSALEIPASGAPFKFEASPPFGLETTFAIVTAVPLNETDFQLIDSGFARPKQEVPTLVASRGLLASARDQIPPTTTDGRAAPSVVWNAITILIRP